MSTRRSVWIGLTLAAMVYAAHHESVIQAQQPRFPNRLRVYVANSDLGSSCRDPLQGDAISVVDPSRADPVLGTVQIEGYPERMALSPDGKQVYVTNGDKHTVFAIDVANLNLSAGEHPPIQRVSVGTYLKGVAVSLDGRELYVADFDDNSVWIINASDNRMKARVRVGIGTGPTGVAISRPDGRWAYVTNTFSDTVSVIDTVARQVTAVVPVGRLPQGIVTSQDGRAFVANLGDDTISVIDTRTNRAVGRLQAGPAPTDVVVNVQANRVYATSLFYQTVTLIDPVSNRIVGRWPAGNANGLAVSENGAFVFVASLSDYALTVIDTAANRTVARIPVGVCPSAVALDSSTGRVYVANKGSGTVSVIDTAAVLNPPVVAMIPTGIHPVAVAPSPDGKQIYVTNADTHSNSVSIIDTGTFQTSGRPIVVGRQPMGVAVKPIDGTRVYVANYDGTISVIDPRTHRVIDVLQAGKALNSIALSPTGGRVYATSSLNENGEVWIIDPSKKVKTVSIRVGTTASGVAVDPVRGQVYVIGTSRPLQGMIALMVPNGNTLGTPSQLDLPFEPSGLAVSPDGSSIYVSGMSDDTPPGSLLIVDPARIRDSSYEPDVVTTGGTAPRGVAVSRDGSTLYVADNAEGTLAILHLSTAEVTRIHLGEGRYPTAVAVVEGP